MTRYSQGESCLQADKKTIRYYLIRVFTQRNVIVLTLVYLLATSFLLALLQIETSQGGNAWKHADWLINNTHVQVRRGWMGSFFLSLSAWTGVSALHLVACIQAVLTLLLFSALWCVGLRLRYNDRVFFLLLSPAFLLFWFNDPQASMRKEMLAYIAFLPLMAVAAGHGGNRSLVIGVVVTWLVFALAVLGHEANAFFAPWYLLAIYLLRPIMDKGFVLLICIFLLAAAAGLIHAASYSRVDDYLQLCYPILEQGEDIRLCGGAMRWLERDLQQSLAGTASLVDGPTLPAFFLSLFFAMGLFIFLAGPYLRLRLAVACSVLGVLWFLPLYLVAVDWGRWINLQITANTLVVLVWLLKQQQRTKVERVAPVTYAGLLIFCSIWGIAHVGGGLSWSHSLAYGVIPKTYMLFMLP